MKVEFDPIADALYIQLAEGEVAKTEEIKPGMMVDYGVVGNMLGIEVLHVSNSIDAYRGSSKCKGTTARLLADRAADRERE